MSKILAKLKEWFGILIAALIFAIAIAEFIFAFIIGDEKKRIQKQQKHIDDIRKKEQETWRKIQNIEREREQQEKSFDMKYQAIKKEGEKHENKVLDFDAAADIIDKFIHSNGNSENTNSDRTGHDRISKKDN